MARFVGGLNREIQDILAFQDYNNVTRLFHLACKAERQVQGRRVSARTNNSAGRTTTWQQRTTTTPTPRAPAPAPSSSPKRAAAAPAPSSDKTRTAPASSAAKTPSASSVASTGRTRDIQCHRCKGHGHVMRDCPSKRVLVIKDDGEYSSASDFDDDTLALLAANHADD